MKRKLPMTKYMGNIKISFIIKTKEAQLTPYQQVEIVHRFTSLPLHSVIAMLQQASFCEKVPLCIIQQNFSGTKRLIRSYIL
jgi:hypothetical protein